MLGICESYSYLTEVFHIQRIIKYRLFSAKSCDLLKTVPLDVEGRPLRGEFLRSATIVNTMIKQLGVFTSDVTRVPSRGW